MADGRVSARFRWLDPEGTEPAAPVVRDEGVIQARQVCLLRFR